MRSTYERLYENLSKYEFWLREVQFLGHLVTQYDILVDPAKVEVVMLWDVMRSPYETWISLGLVGYYQRFIQYLSNIDVPLT